MSVLFIYLKLRNMRTIHLKQPYKILENRLKRYETHYQIPAERCVIIPVKNYGGEIACDVRWKDINGELQVKGGLFFNAENIEPIDAMKNYQMHELWSSYMELTDPLKN